MQILQESRETQRKHVFFGLEPAERHAFIDDARLVVPSGVRIDAGRRRIVRRRLH
jgi:hypothetical protein